MLQIIMYVHVYTQQQKAAQSSLFRGTVHLYVFQLEVAVDKQSFSHFILLTICDISAEVTYRYIYMYVSNH